MGLPLFTSDTASWMTDAVILNKRLAVTPATPAWSAAEYDNGSSAQRDRYDSERFVFMSDFVVETVALRKLAIAMKRTMLVNQYPKDGRYGILLSGDAGLGKSTALRAIAGWTVRRYALERPELLAGGALPVVYVSIPPQATPKTLLQRIAASVHLPYTPRDTAEVIRMQLVPLLEALGTQVIMVDEFHRLEKKVRSNEATNDALKDLGDLLPCTLICAGIDLDRSGIINDGVRGKSIGGRYSMFRLAPFTAADRAEWDRIVGGFVARSHLFGRVEVSSSYLLKRTGGSIGVLNSLFLQAVGLKLSDEHRAADEVLTRDDFEAAILPVDAEVQLARQ